MELQLGISIVFWVVSSRLHTGAELLVDVELVLRVVISASVTNSSETENESTTSTAVRGNGDVTKPVTAPCFWICGSGTCTICKAVYLELLVTPVRSQASQHPPLASRDNGRGNIITVSHQLTARVSHKRSHTKRGTLETDTSECDTSSSDCGDRGQFLPIVSSPLGRRCIQVVGFRSAPTLALVTSNSCKEDGTKIG